MDLIADAVAGGITAASRRLGLVLADMAAKGVWLAATALMLLVAFSSFAPRLSPPAGTPPELAGLYVMASVLEGWPGLMARVALAGIGSFALWSLLEAFVRSRIVGWVWDRPPVNALFTRFLASGLLRRLAFAFAAVMVGLVVLGPGLAEGSGEWIRAWPETRWAVAGGLLILVLVAFVLMLLDTLVRCDAVETLGGSLGPVVAAVAAIGLLEVLVRLSAVMATLIAMSVMPAPLALLLAVPLATIGLSTTHSFLLLVRYSAIGIIRQHIEYPRSTDDAPGHSI